MHPGRAGAASGVILGIVLVLLAQQFGYFDLSTFVNALIILIAVAILFGVVFGILGIALYRSALRRAGGVQPWEAPAGTSSSSSPPPTPAPAAPAEAPAAPAPATPPAEAEEETTPPSAP